MKSSILTRFTYIINSIKTLRTENERDFSLAGIYNESSCANLSVEMPSGLILININSADLGRNTTIDVFGVSLDAAADIVYDMESNPYTFAYASDT